MVMHRTARGLGDVVDPTERLAVKGLHTLVLAEELDKAEGTGEQGVQ